MVKAEFEVPRQLRTFRAGQRKVWLFCGEHAAGWPPVMNGKVTVTEVLTDVGECDACAIAAMRRREEAGTEDSHPTGRVP